MMNFGHFAKRKVPLLLAACATVLTIRAAVPEGNDRSRVSVECSRSSGLIQVNILNFRKIGHVQITVKDAQGKTLYIEEGKSMSEELIRRLDKGMFPKGAATLVVEARDFNITHPFTIQ